MALGRPPLRVLPCLLALALGCHRPTGAPSAPGSPDGGTSPGLRARGEALRIVDSAEDGRRASDLAPDLLVSADVEVRRRATRALSRIVEAPLDASAEASLLRAMGDDDLEVVAWGAYGLGWACHGKEEEHVKALAARASTLFDRPSRADGGAGDAGESLAAGGRGQVDGRASVVRAMGRCGGPLAESVLVGLLRSVADADVEEVAYALGSVAGRRSLTDEAMDALLDRATGTRARAANPAALYPIGRLEHVPVAWAARTLEAARAALTRGGSCGAFAVRALEKIGLDAVPELGRLASGHDVDASERAEAARALGRLGTPGREAASAALARVTVDRTTLEPAGLAGDGFNVLLALVEAVASDAPRAADASLRALASMAVPGPDAAASTLPAAHRVVSLRCAAAAGLARAAYDADVLVHCDPDPAGAAGQRARLAALVRRPLVTDRKKAFRVLAASSKVTVREAAIEAVASHPELEDAGRAVLVQALAADEAGIVATAALAIVQHPERALTLSKAERLAALDPKAPPPTTHPTLDLPADVASALSKALARPWKEDAVETRTALVDAALAVSHPEAKAAATRACADANVTLRAHAAKALRALGASQAACPAPRPTDAAAPPGPPVLEHAVKVAFDVSGAKLAVVFEPDLAPRAASRFVALARAGFYRGVVVHRVVPGYVVQFGDPGGDGYGGSGTLLRCETSPVPFGPLDVGVALAGRDTGSSQVFVTLGRYPKLDGDYARVGRAEGDWGAVAEGDVIDGVRVEE